MYVGGSSYPRVISGEVAELDQPTACGYRHVADIVQAVELAAHAHHDAVAFGVDLAACQHAVLIAQAFGDLQWRDPERGQPLVGELDVDLLRLLAVDVDLLDHRHLQQPTLDVLGDIRQLPLADAVALDRIEQPGHVAVFVVEDRADDAFGQIELDVAELLARLVPCLALILVGRTADDGDRHAAVALARIGLDLLEVVELLELLLHAVEHFVLHLLRGGAGPDHDRRHRRHREVRVFELAELREAQHAADGDHEDHEQHDGAVVQRPFGEVERFHRAACLDSRLGVGAGKRDLQAGRHLLHARGDDELSGLRPGHEHVVVAILVDDDVRQVHGSDRFATRAANDPDRGLALVLRDRRCGDRGRRRVRGGALDDEPRARAERQRPRRRGLQAGAEGARRRSSLRRELPQHDVERLVGRAREHGLVPRRLECRQLVLGHVDDDLRLDLLRDRDDRLPFGHDLADLELHTGDHAILRCAQRRVLQAIAREVELSRVGFGGGARRLRAALRFLFVGRADRTVRLQRVQPLPIRLRLPCLRLRCGELLLRGFHRELVIGVIEHGDDVALPHLLTHVDLAAHHLAADAESLVDLVARLYRAEVAVGFLRPVVADLGGTDHSKRLRSGLRRAGGEHRRDRNDQKGQSEMGFHGVSSYRSKVHELGERAALAAGGSATGSNTSQPPPSAL